MYRRNYGVKLKNKYRKTLATYIATKVSIYIDAVNLGFRTGCIENVHIQLNEL